MRGTLAAMQWDAGLLARRVEASLGPGPDSFPTGGVDPASGSGYDPDLLEFIDRGYREVLGRPADPAGLRFFGELVATGVEPSAIVGMLVRSDEAANRRRSVDFEGGVVESVVRLEAELRVAGVPVVRADVIFVIAAYAVLLGREPDSEGFVGIYRFLRSGGATRGVVKRIALREESLAWAGVVGLRRRLQRRLRISALVDAVHRTTLLYALVVGTALAVAPGGDRSPGALEP